MKENKGKKYVSHTRDNVITDRIKDKIAELYFSHGLTNTQIHKYLKDEEELEIAETTLRGVITKQRKEREEIKREVLKEHYSEMFRAEKEKLHWEAEFYAQKALEIWEKLPIKERQSWKSWAKLMDLKHKTRDQMVALEMASVDPEKIDDIDETLKTIKDKLKLDESDNK